MEWHEQHPPELMAVIPEGEYDAYVRLNSEPSAYEFLRMKTFNEQILEVVDNEKPIKESAFQTIQNTKRKSMVPAGIKKIRKDKPGDIAINN